MAASHLILDLETVAIDEAVNFIDVGEPPDNYKNAEAIEGWKVRTRYNKALKAALDIDLARIVCLGVMDGDECIQQIATTEADEREILADFAARFDGRQLITFNGYRYDLALLARRYLYLGLPVPFSLLNFDVFKNNHVDLWWILAQRGKGSAHSLNWYAKRLGWRDVLDRDPLDEGGASVAQALALGDVAGIAAHNGCDLELTKRLARWMGVIP